MLRTLATVVFVGLVGLPLSAQAQMGGYSDQGIPSGYMPPPGSCRVWYDGVQPSQQPPVTNCRDAERIVSGDRRARVIYGGAPDSPGTWTDRDMTRYSQPDRVVIVPDRTTIAFTGGDRVSFENGYQDGYEQGRDDARDRDGYDPARHGRYKDADHKYEREYGAKDRYKAVYRNGFLDGYAAGYGAVSGFNSRVIVYRR